MATLDTTRSDALGGIAPDTSRSDALGTRSVPSTSAIEPQNPNSDYFMNQINKIQGYINENNTPQVSTTTISNANKIGQVAGLNADLTKYSDKGLRTDSDGNTRTAGGSFADLTESTADADTSDEDAQTAKLLRQMQSSLDSTTQGLIENIQQKFALRKQEQADVNTRQNKAYKNALLMGGATGAGSSAQYAPISSEGIIGAQESYGIRQIADLDSQEQDLIMQAKAAQEAGNFKILESKLAQVEAKRQQKIEATTKLNEEINKRNAEIRAKTIQSSRDNAISDLYSQGVTDVSSMLDYLNHDDSGKTTGDFTAQEISDTLKNIVPPGLDDLVKTLRTNGAPPEVIQRVMSSGNMGDAYKNAGGYASGGTGIIGEYNYYRAQALGAGQVPVDFNTYQNLDANRKAKVAAAANANGLSNATATKVQTIAGQFDGEPSVKNYQVVSEGKSFMDSISDTTTNPADQQGIIYAFAKVMDPNSVVREGEYNTVQKYAQSWADTFGFNASRIFSNSPFLSSEAIKNMKKTIESKAKASENSYKNIYDEYGRRIDKITGMKDGTEYITDYSGGYGGTGSDVIQQGNIAKNQVDSAYTNGDANTQKVIESLVNGGKNDIEIVEYLKSKGLIQ